MGVASGDGAGRVWSPAPWWLRAFLLVNVVQDAAIGASGLLSPAHIVIPLKGLSPPNARFIASLYLGGGIVILLAALVRRAVDARIALYSLLAITTLVLAMTLVYWREFSADGVPWLWMTTYVADPVVLVLAIGPLGVLRAAAPGRHRLTGLFAGQAVVFGGAGIALLLAPDMVLDGWPWSLTRLLARVYAAFFLAFAAGAVLAAFERREAAVRPFLAGSLALVACTLGISVLHRGRFDHGPGSWLWFAVLAAGLALFGFALVSVLPRSRGRRPVPAAER